VAIGAYLDIAGETLALAGEVFEPGLLGWRQGIAQPHRKDRHAPRGVLVNARLTPPARQGGEMLDPLDHAADHRDVAIELARSVADHRVKLGAGAGVGRKVAGDTDRGIAVDRPARA